MIVGLILLSIYIGYFLIDYFRNMQRDRLIKKYEETHYSDEQKEPEKDKVIRNRKQWYHDVYLQSDHWKELRKVALKRADYKCQICAGRDKRLNVHHNTYDNIWHERMTDLCVLCEDCHELYSKSKKKYRYK